MHISLVCLQSFFPWALPSRLRLSSGAVGVLGEEAELWDPTCACAGHQFSNWVSRQAAPGVVPRGSPPSQGGTKAEFGCNQQRRFILANYRWGFACGTRVAPAPSPAPHVVASGLCVATMTRQCPCGGHPWLPACTFPGDGDIEDARSEEQSCPAPTVVAPVVTCRAWDLGCRDRGRVSCHRPALGWACLSRFPWCVGAEMELHYQLVRK